MLLAEGYKSDNPESDNPESDIPESGKPGTGGFEATADGGDSTPADRSFVRAADLARALKLLAEADGLRARAAILVGPLADAGLAEWHGYVSMERLIAHQNGSRNATARAFTRIARFLDANPASAAALVAGRLSMANAEVLARVAGGDLARRFAEDETQLLTAAEGRSPEDFDKIVYAWRTRVDEEANAEDAERTWRNRSLTMQMAFDGSCRGQFQLGPVDAEIVATALHTSPDAAGTFTEPRTLGQRQADALVDICLRDLTGHGSSPEPDDCCGHGEDCCGHGEDCCGHDDSWADRDSGPGPRASVDVVIDVETLAGTSDPVVVDRLRQELGRGGPIGGPGLDRLLCDASFRALITDGPRTVLAYNRATPEIPPALRRAVKLRDRGCTFPGCDRPAHWCDNHHIVPRNRGGPTTLENLTLLCRFHHTAVHAGGWQLTRAPDGTIEVTSP